MMQNKAKRKPKCFKSLIDNADPLVNAKELSTTVHLSFVDKERQEIDLGDNMQNLETIVGTLSNQGTGVGFKETSQAI